MRVRNKQRNRLDISNEYLNQLLERIHLEAKQYGEAHRIRFMLNKTELHEFEKIEIRGDKFDTTLARYHHLLSDLNKCLRNAHHDKQGHLDDNSGHLENLHNILVNELKTQQEAEWQNSVKYEDDIDQQHSINFALESLRNHSFYLTAEDKVFADTWNGVSGRDCATNEDIYPVWKELSKEIPRLLKNNDYHSIPVWMLGSLEVPPKAGSAHDGKNQGDQEYGYSQQPIARDIDFSEKPFTLPTAKETSRLKDELAIWNPINLKIVFFNALMDSLIKTSNIDVQTLIDEYCNTFESCLIILNRAHHYANKPAEFDHYAAKYTDVGTKYKPKKEADEFKSMLDEHLLILNKRFHFEEIRKQTKINPNIHACIQMPTFSESLRIAELKEAPKEVSVSHKSDLLLMEEDLSELVVDPKLALDLSDSENESELAEALFEANPANVRKSEMMPLRPSSTVSPPMELDLYQPTWSERHPIATSVFKGIAIGFGLAALAAGAAAAIIFSGGTLAPAIIAGIFVGTFVGGMTIGGIVGGIVGKKQQEHHSQQLRQMSAIDSLEFTEDLSSSESDHDFDSSPSPSPNTERKVVAHTGKGKEEQSQTPVMRRRSPSPQNEKKEKEAQDLEMSSDEIRTERHLAAVKASSETNIRTIHTDVIPRKAYSENNLFAKQDNAVAKIQEVKEAPTTHYNI